jgi:hypothetical protein
MSGRFWRGSLLAFMGGHQAAAQDWPTLPSKGFISGRAATKQDVANGNAIFVAELNGNVIGIPIRITIPQYAYLSESSGKVSRVIVVQAEEANGHKLFGVRDLRGQEFVATDSDLRLVGIEPR